MIVQIAVITASAVENFTAIKSIRFIKPYHRFCASSSRRQRRAIELARWDIGSGNRFDVVERARSVNYFQGISGGPGSVDDVCHPVEREDLVHMAAEQIDVVGGTGTVGGDAGIVQE